MATKEPCGCRANDREYTSMCPACAAEFSATHAQAMADYREQESQRKNRKENTRNVYPENR